MAAWTADELARIGVAEELQIASRRPDGSLRPYVTIWAVRVDDGVYVRSAFGRDNPWYRRALTTLEGSIRVGGVQRDVVFEEPDTSVDDAVDAAYHAKYDRHGPAIVGTVVSAEAARATLRVTPKT